MKIYLDVCCLNRPFDDQQQVRVRSEAEAVRLILRRVDRGRWAHVSSEMAVIEINAIADVERRRKILAMLPTSRDIMALSDLVFT